MAYSAKVDPAILAHLEWMGFVRPTGLVVSAPALVRAGAILDRRDAEGQQLLRAAAGAALDDPAPVVTDFCDFARTVLGWSFSAKAYAGTAENPIPPELEVALPDYGETLRPDFAVRELEPESGRSPWQLLVRFLDSGADFDRMPHGAGFDVSAHGRMERLLRQTQTPAGLLFNGRTLRLISAPHAESSGWLDFQVADMLQTAGRPIATAMRLLLSERRLLSLPRKERLAALLEDSRKFQNEVSERLAEQVLHALYEFLRGFQAAHDASYGELLRQPLSENPDEVYRALLTVILRLVFLLYAEERDMLPEDEYFLRYYSLAGLYERLREDAALYPDTMDQRYGAWAQLLVLFRMIHDGAESGVMKLPKRHGVLFDPDRFPFLEGRPVGVVRQMHERIEVPLVPDGTVYRAFEKLLVLDGERISYRALDVEQIGSVYETMMGFRLETAVGRSVAIKPQRKQGAPTVVDLEALLAEPSAKRAKWLQDQTSRKFTDTVKAAVAAAASVEDFHVALLPVVDNAASPDLVARGAMTLQPSEERRRSGSHYTPRALTEPIVRTTLEPILSRLTGKRPRPEQILDLKVCDPAMGSGAFLVEVCRQLGDALVEAWRTHGGMPLIPADEDEFIFARRLIAQRCLYGVDRNPLAVDLARVSLWLVTLAKDHPFTFLDHALRHGDSLVGLSRKQIEAFHWEPTGAVVKGLNVREPIDKVFELRRRIREADERISDWELRDLWDEAKFELAKVQILGDLIVAAFFEGERTVDREAKRMGYLNTAVTGVSDRYRDHLHEWRQADLPLAPFHWEIEFPEVFDRGNPGFDAIVGNPPFAGKNTVANANVKGYPDWLKALHQESHGNADLVAHFYRRAFDLIRKKGAFGLIATNTIAQGDTRSTGLRWICQHSGEIFHVQKRLKWPGLAAVVVSVVHVMKDSVPEYRTLDGRNFNTITAFLFHRGGHEDPARLASNRHQSFQGCVVVGMGFTFDDEDRDRVASSLSEMRRLIEKNPRNQEVIFPYIGGEEVSASPTQAPRRFIINFGERSEEQCRERWPDLMDIVEKKVRTEREAALKESRSPDKEKRAKQWWQFARFAKDLYAAAIGLERVLVVPQTSNAQALAYLPANFIFAHTLVVFSLAAYSEFCILQSRVHQSWAAFLGPTMKDDLRYTPSDCFETFPFPQNCAIKIDLDLAGKAYYEFRAALMVRNNEGLTKTYNRFHDPGEDSPDILNLRELHAAMDRAVLHAYGWTDIPTGCNFILDYQIEEEEWGDKKKPYRYRWPDDVRDEVLARLLELNASRAREEARSGLAAAKKTVKKNKAKPDTNKPQIEDLFS
jgi:hypothetical protein